MFFRRVVAFFVAFTLLTGLWMTPAIVYAENGAESGNVLLFSKLMSSSKENYAFGTNETYDRVTRIFESNGHNVIRKASSTESYELTRDDLENVNLVMLIYTLETYSQSEVDVLSEYLNRGGRIFIQAEHGGYSGAENVIATELVQALGGNFEITGRAISVRPNNEMNENMGDTPLLAGVTELISAYIAPIECEGSVVPVLYDHFIDGSYEGVFMVDQAVGKGRITALSDINIFNFSTYDQVEKMVINLLQDSIENQDAVQSGENPNSGFGGSPDVILNAPGMPVSGDGDYAFQVVYQGQDGVAINQETIDVADVAVKDESNVDLLILDAEITNSDDPGNIEVTYTVKAPDGGWVRGRRYTIQIVNAQVEDVNGGQVGGNNSAGTIGADEPPEPVLTVLSVMGYNLDQPFDPSVTDYTVSGVAESQADIAVDFLHDQGFAVRVGEVSVASGSTLTVDLVNGANLIDIEVTAQDGIETKTYTLVINRLSDVANLALLKVDNHEIDPIFEKDTTSYSVHVTSGSAITVLLSPEDKNAEVDLSQYDVISSGAVKIPVSVGRTVHEFKVTAENGKYEKTYVLSVDRDNDDATPQNIEVIGYQASQSFNGATLSYTAPSTEQSSVDVRVTMSEYDSIRINGVSAESGELVKVPLSTGENIIRIASVAEDGIHEKVYRIHIERIRRNDRDRTNDSGKTDDPASAMKSQMTTIYVNGEQENGGSEILSSVNGETVASVIVDRDEILRTVSRMHKSGENNVNSVVVPVRNGDADIVEVKLTGDLVQAMSGADFDLTVQAENVEYVIPARQIQIEGVARHFDMEENDLQSIEIIVSMNKLAPEDFASLEQKAKAQGMEIAAPPIEFEIKAIVNKNPNDEQSVNVTKFNRFVERRIRLDESAGPEMITTGVLIDQDGTFSHIPTKVIVKDGVYYATMNSMTNSKYMLVYNPVTVESAENHWSETAVNNLASRLIIEDPQAFEPDRAITRGDLVSYVVKALGLYRTGVAHEMIFTDIDHENADLLSIASDYGIVSGYTDGSFRADSPISREEAMVILNKALDAVNAVDEHQLEQRDFKDADEVSIWAREAVRRIVGLGIMNGTGMNMLDPKGTMTYAQAVSSIENLLVLLDLINN